MRIEVLVGSNDPLIFPINKPRLSIGSAEGCDVVISADGVSRKHLIIVVEGETFFITDQGSTNGSFVNEERLVPGKRVEFTSFFPVRLGDHVLVSLLSEEESAEMGAESSLSSFPELTPEASPKSSDAGERTTVISLRDLKNAKTETLVKARDQKRTITKAKVSTSKTGPVKKKAKPRRFVPLLSLLLFVGAAAYNIFMVEQEPPPVKILKVGEVVKSEPKPNPDPVKEIALVPSEEEIPKAQSYENLIGDLKCVTEVEAPLCDAFPGARENGFGVVQVGLSFYVLVNANAHVEEAKKHLPAEREDNVEENKVLLKDVAAYLYLISVLKSPTGIPNLSAHKDFNVYILLYTGEEASRTFLRGIALKADRLPVLPEAVQEPNLYLIRTTGPAALAITKNYYRTF